MKKYGVSIKAMKMAIISDSNINAGIQRSYRWRWRKIGRNGNIGGDGVTGGIVKSENQSSYGAYQRPSSSYPRAVAYLALYRACWRILSAGMAPAR